MKIYIILGCSKRGAHVMGAFRNKQDAEEFLDFSNKSGISTYTMEEVYIQEKSMFLNEYKTSYVLYI